MCDLMLQTCYDGHQGFPAALPKRPLILTDSCPESLSATPHVVLMALLFADEQQCKFCAKQAACKASTSHLCGYVLSSSSLPPTLLYQHLICVSFVSLMVLHLIFPGHGKLNTLTT